MDIFVLLFVWNTISLWLQFIAHKSLAYYFFERIESENLKLLQIMLLNKELVHLLC